jgi:hypothetical protein
MLVQCMREDVWVVGEGMMVSQGPQGGGGWCLLWIHLSMMIGEGVTHNYHVTHDAYVCMYRSDVSSGGLCQYAGLF